MNLIELGELLKTERERRKLSLRDVMESTKISRRNLNALEAGEIKSLPHPVYLKGYVRNYARLVGLDAEPLVAVVELQSDGDSGYIVQTASTAPLADPPVASLEASVVPPPAVDPAPGDPDSSAGLGVSAPLVPEAMEPAEQQLTVTAPQADEPQVAPAPAPEAAASQIRFAAGQELSPKPRKPVWPWLLLLAFAACMALLYVQYVRIQSEAEQAAPPVLAAPAPVENATAANATDNATEANATAPAVPEPAAPASPAPAPAVVPAPAAPASRVAPAAAPAPATKPAAQSASPATLSVPSSPIEVSRKAPAAQPAPSAPAAEVRTPGMQELVIVGKPGEECWVEVSEGSQRKSFTLRNGDSRRFEFSSKAKVRLGNAGGVSFQLNGAHYPFEGERGATATVEIGAR